MAFVQNVPRPNQVHNFSLQNYAGGLNNRSELLEDNQCSDVLNMTFYDDTILEKRMGTTYFDSMRLENPITWVDEFKPYAEPEIMVRASNSELYIGDTKIKNLPGNITGINFQGKYFFADGTGMYAYGKFPRDASTFVKIIGTYTAHNILMNVVSPPSGYIPLGSEFAKGIYVYDYTNREVWYEPCKQEIEDTYKNANAVPFKIRFMITHNGRIYASGSDEDDDNVFITDVNNPYYFASALPIQLPPNSDRVSALHVFDDSVVVGRRADIYAITGQALRSDVGVPIFQLNRINSHTGIASHHAVDIAHNFLFFLGTDGNSYSLAGTNGGERVLATSVISKNVDPFRPPVSLNKSDIFTASSLFFDDKWYLSMGSKVLVYSFRVRAWTMYEGFDATSFYKFHHLMIWGNSQGMISMPSENYLDYGSPYHSYWKSKYFDMGNANAEKYIREFFAVCHTFDYTMSRVNFLFEIDYYDSKSNTTIENALAVWGVSVFSDQFITRNLNRSFAIPIGRRGRNIRITFSNGYNYRGRVNSVNDINTFSKPKNLDMIFADDDSTYYVHENFEWKPITMEDLDQPMRVYQVNGEYEYRRKR